MAIKFEFVGDNMNLLRSIEGSKQGIRSLTREAEKESMSMDDIMKRIGQSAAAIGIGFSATQLVRDVARVRGEFQQLEVALTTMLGSEEKANALFGQLVNTAAKTPFDLKGVAGGAKQLLAYGVAAEEVNDTIIRLGDIAAGLSIPLGDLVYLYGTTMTQGRLFTQDLRQFMGRGIPLAEELAKQFGVTKDEVGGLVTAGKVGFPEVQKAIMAMTSEGGKFAGLMENQSKTITGQISNLEDAVDSMFNEIGKSTQGVISGVLSTTTKLVENYEKVGEAIGVIVTMYGTYKAAQAIHIAMMKAENAITQQAILLKSQYAKAGHLITDSMARGAAKSVLFADAQKRIVTAMKTVGKTAGVYGLIAIAVTGVVYGIYKLVTAKSAEEKAIERVNKEREESIEQREKEKSRIDELLGVIDDETRTRTEQVGAYEELKGLLPELTKEKSLEELQTMSNVEIQKAYNEELEKAEYDKAVANAESYRKKLEELEAEEKKAANTSVTSQAQAQQIAMRLKMINQEKKDYEERLRQTESFIKEQNKIKEQAKPIDMKIKDAEAEASKAKAVYERLKDELDRLPPWEMNWALEQNVKRAREAYIQTQENLSNLQEQADKEDSKPKNKEYWEDKKKAAEQNRDVLDVSEIGGAKWKQYEAEIKEADRMLERYSGKYLDSIKKRDEELKKLKQQTSDDLTSIEEDELERQLAAINNSYVKRKEEIAKQEKEWRDAQRGALTKEQQESITSAYSAAQTKRDKEQEKATIEHEQKIADQIISMRKKTNDDLASLDENEHNRKMAQIKNDYENRIAEIAKQEREWSEAQGGTLTVEQQSTVTNAYNAAESKRYNEEKKANKENLDKMLADVMTYQQAREKVEKDYAKERKKLESTDGVTKENLAQHDENRDKALQAIDEQFASKSQVYLGWLESISDMTIVQLNRALGKAQAELDSLQGKSDANPEDLARARAQIAVLQKKIEQLKGKGEAGTRTIDTWKDLGEVLGDTAKEFETLGDAIGGTAGEIVSSLGSTFTSTVGLMNNIVQFTDICSKGIMNTAGTAVSAVKAVEAASVILAVISAAIQIIQKIADVAKNLHNKQYEKTIEDNQKDVDELKASYSELEEVAEKTFGSDKVSNLRDMNEKLEEQNKLIQDQKDAEESKKGDVDTTQYDDAMEANRKQMEENTKAMEEAIFGDDIKSAIESFAEAYGDAIAEGKDLNQSMKDHAVEMMKQMVQEEIKAYIAGQGKLEALREKMALYFEDGVFSDSEIAAIKAEAEAIGRDLDEKFAWAEDLLAEEESSSGSSKSKRGIATASQESVDENNGRLMSIQLSMGEIKEQMIYTVTYLASMTSSISSGNHILSDIREQAVRANGLLEDIVKYTKPLNDKVGEVVSAVNRISSK